MTVRDQVVADIIANTTTATSNIRQFSTVVGQSSQKVTEFRGTVETAMQRIGRSWASGLVALVSLRAAINLTATAWDAARTAQEKMDRTLHGFTTLGVEATMSSFASGLERAERAAKGVNEWLGEIMRKPLNTLGGVFATITGGAGERADEMRRQSMVDVLKAPGFQGNPAMIEDLQEILKRGSQLRARNSAYVDELIGELNRLLSWRDESKPLQPLGGRQIAAPKQQRSGAPVPPPGRLGLPGEQPFFSGILGSDNEIMRSRENAAMLRDFPVQQQAEAMATLAGTGNAAVDVFRQFRDVVPEVVGGANTFTMAMDDMNASIKAELVSTLASAAGNLGEALGSGQIGSGQLASQMAQMIRQLGVLVATAGAQLLVESWGKDPRGWALLGIGAALGFGGGLVAGLINKGAGGGGGSSGMPRMSGGGGATLPQGQRIINITVQGSVISDDQLEDRILGALAKT